MIEKDEDYIEGMNTQAFLCGGCGEYMQREYNAKWLIYNYVCYGCNHGFQFVGIWDYDACE